MDEIERLQLRLDEHKDVIDGQRHEIEQLRAAIEEWKKEEEDWHKEATQLRADKKRLDNLADFVLAGGGFFEYHAIERYDMEDVLKECGLIEDAKVTAEDMEHGWPIEVDMTEGDDCLKITARGRAAIDAAREGEK